MYDRVVRPETLLGTGAGHDKREVCEETHQTSNLKCDCKEPLRDAELTAHVTSGQDVFQHKFKSPPAHNKVSLYLDSVTPTLNLRPLSSEGPFVFGYVFCFGLMGVLSVQCFFYFRKFPRDQIGTKLLVALVLFLESLITLFALHGFWISVIVQSSDLSAIVGAGIGGKYLSPAPIWSFVGMAILTGLVSSITHGFFCWRIWIFRQSQVVPVLVMMVSLLQCAMVCYGSIKYGLVPDLTASHPMPFYVPLWLCGSLVCDLTITAYMTTILLRGRSGLKSTQSILTKVIKLNLEAGLVTTTAAVVELILAIAFRVTMYHLAV
ncbi:hypothetical protein J3R83DRAFT_2671 [Lanmaoa asiatica]|nr:hypothetical protein J3R83DRAFT_2671 [Lanmaoa asiatica]